MGGENNYNYLYYFNIYSFYFFNTDMLVFLGMVSI